MSAAKKPVPVIIYDRIQIPPLTESLGTRVNRCKTWAYRHGHPVVGLRIDEGKAAAFDGERWGEWPLISHGRPQLADALGLVIEYDGALLVSSRERLSSHQRCVDELLRRWPVRLLVAEDIPATVSPSRGGKS